MNGGEIHLLHDGPEGLDPLVLLHPLPHDGRFFDPVTAQLCREREVLRPDYPGFGESPVGSETPSIAGYAGAIAASLDRVAPLNLLGFHTGCLVAAELALRHPNRVARIILIDVPCFGPAEAADMLRSVETSDKYDQQAIAGFRAAFAYPAIERLAQVQHPTLVIATASSLREATLRAAELPGNVRLELLDDVRAPVFEQGADAICALCSDFLS